jgi:hypothetical protein
MKRVYVAGAYSGSNVIEILGNMRRGMKLSTEVLEAGYAPFVPWFDFHFSLISDKIKLQHYYDYSIAWLRVSDAMILVPENLAGSKGTQEEIRIAREELNIPIFDSIEELTSFFADLNNFQKEV